MLESVKSCSVAFLRGTTAPCEGGPFVAVSVCTVEACKLPVHIYMSATMTNSSILVHDESGFVMRKEHTGLLSMLTVAIRDDEVNYQLIAVHNLMKNILTAEDQKVLM